MLRLPALAEELAGRGQQVQRLLGALLTALLEDMSHSPAAGQKLLQDLAAKAPIASCAEALASGILLRASQAEQEGGDGHLQQTLRCVRPCSTTACASGKPCATRGTLQWMQSGLPKRRKACPDARRALDVRYPKQVDAAVNKALRPLTKRTKPGKGPALSSSEAGSGGPGGDLAHEEGARRALEFVRRALDKHGASAVLRDAPATLALAVDAPSAELRRLVRCAPAPCCLSSCGRAQDPGKGLP